MTTSYETDEVEKVCTYLYFTVLNFINVILYFKYPQLKCAWIWFDIYHDKSTGHGHNFRKKKNPTHGLKLGPYERFKI